MIFSGVDHYITPNWYPSRREHGKVVPTWNYAAVHVTGTARLFEDPPSLLRHINELTDFHESGSSEKWSVSDAPPEYIDGMTKAIVGVEMKIDKIEGKWKMSQNRPPEDRKGVVAGLEEAGSPAAQEMAKAMRERS